MSKCSSCGKKTDGDRCGKCIRKNLWPSDFDSSAPSAPSPSLPPSITLPFIPTAVWSHILSFTDTEDVCITGAVCRDLLEASHSPLLPARIYATMFTDIASSQGFKECNNGSPPRARKTSFSAFDDFCDTLTGGSKEPSHPLHGLPAYYVSGVELFLSHCTQLRALAIPFISPTVLFHLNSLPSHSLVHLDLTRQSRADVDFSASHPRPPVDCATIASAAPSLTVLLLTRNRIVNLPSLRVCESLVRLDLSDVTMMDLLAHRESLRGDTLHLLRAVYDETKLAELVASGFCIDGVPSHQTQFVRAFFNLKATEGRHLAVNGYDGRRPVPLTLVCGQCDAVIAPNVGDYFVGKPTQEHITFELYFNGPLQEGLADRSLEPDATLGWFNRQGAFDCQCGWAAARGKFLIAERGGMIDTMGYEHAAACGCEYVEVREARLDEQMHAKAELGESDWRSKLTD